MAYTSALLNYKAVIVHTRKSSLIIEQINLKNMKKIYMRAVVICMIALPLYINVQVSILGQSGANTDYVGWNNAQNFPLQIKHEGNQPINILTNNTLLGYFTTPTFLVVAPHKAVACVL